MKYGTLTRQVYPLFQVRTLKILPPVEENILQNYCLLRNAANRFVLPLIVYFHVKNMKIELIYGEHRLDQ